MLTSTPRSPPAEMGMEFEPTGWELFGSIKQRVTGPCGPFMPTTSSKYGSYIDINNI
jgi:hypothetical protein